MDLAMATLDRKRPGRHQVMEIFSAPRLVPMATKVYGLKASLSFGPWMECFEAGAQADWSALGELCEARVSDAFASLHFLLTFHGDVELQKNAEG